MENCEARKASLAHSSKAGKEKRQLFGRVVNRKDSKLSFWLTEYIRKNAKEALVFMYFWDSTSDLK